MRRPRLGALVLYAATGLLQGEALALRADMSTGCATGALRGASRTTYGPPARGGGRKPAWLLEPRQRRGRDSNPRSRVDPLTRFPVALLKPLGHLSQRPEVCHRVCSRPAPADAPCRQ